MNQPPNSGPQLSMRDLLHRMSQRGASDLHITTGVPPMIRVDGNMVPIEGFPQLGPDQTMQLCYSVMTEAQRADFEKNLEYDLAFNVKGLSRFRANIFHQRGAVACKSGFIVILNRQRNAFAQPFKPCIVAAHGALQFREFADHIG